MYRIISIPLQELVNEINECARTAAEEAAAEASAAPNLGEERVVSKSRATVCTFCPKAWFGQC